MCLCVVASCTGGSSYDDSNGVVHTVTQSGAVLTLRTLAENYCSVQEIQRSSRHSNMGLENCFVFVGAHRPSHAMYENKWPDEFSL